MVALDKKLYYTGFSNHKKYKEVEKTTIWILMVLSRKQ